MLLGCCMPVLTPPLVLLGRADWVFLGWGPFKGLLEVLLVWLVLSPPRGRVALLACCRSQNASKAACSRALIVGAFLPAAASAARWSSAAAWAFWSAS